jgi:ribosome-binding protein aMBF1 (putative translation factor)
MPVTLTTEECRELALLRERLGWSQRDLAERVNLREREVVDAEEGRPLLFNTYKHRLIDEVRVVDRMMRRRAPGAAGGGKKKRGEE